MREAPCSAELNTLAMMTRRLPEPRARLPRCSCVSRSPHTTCRPPAQHRAGRSRRLAESRCSRRGLFFSPDEGSRWARVGRWCARSGHQPPLSPALPSLGRGFIPQSGWLPHTAPGTGPVTQAARRGAGEGEGVSSAHRVCFLVTEKQLPRHCIQ